MIFLRRCTGLVLAVLTGITLGIAMGMVLLITVHCARYRYMTVTRYLLTFGNLPSPPPAATS